MMCEVNVTVETPNVCSNVDVNELIDIDNIIFQSHLRVMYPLELAISSIGFVMNLISLAALKCTQLPRKPIHYILIHIALADLIYMALTMANCILIVRMQAQDKPIQEIGNFDCSDDILEDMCRHFTLVPLYCTTGAVIALYLGVTKPLEYRSMMTASRITIGMSLCYITTIAVYITLHARFTQFRVYWYVHDCWTYMYDRYLQASSLYLGLLCLVLFVGNITLWGLIVKNARSTEANPSGRIDSDKGRKKKKLFITVSVLLGTNVLFWTPALCTFFFIYYMALEKNDPVSVNIVIAQSLTSFVTNCNSLVNPIIYGIRLPDVRIGYRRLALKLTCNREELRRLDETLHKATRGVPLQIYRVRSD